MSKPLRPNHFTKLASAPNRWDTISISDGLFGLGDMRPCVVCGLLCFGLATAVFNASEGSSSLRYDGNDIELKAEIETSNPWDDIALLSSRIGPRSSSETALPSTGVAAILGPGESHVYTINLTAANIKYTLSLSECQRIPLSAGPLYLSSGGFNESTISGGLLQVSNTSLLNDTLVVSAPAGQANTQWHYQLAYDKTAQYASRNPGLYLVDTDFANALFVTEDYANFSAYVVNTPFKDCVNQSDLNSTTTRFSLFLHQINHDRFEEIHDSPDGDDYEDDPNNYGDPTYNEKYKNDITYVLGRSFCAMQQNALLNQNNAVFSTTTRDIKTYDNSTVYRGQFLFHGLNKSAEYVMHLGVPAKNDSLGGFLFNSVPVRTKSSTSCQLIYNMSMCPNTAFSVPGNASVFTTDELTSLYDQYVRQVYNNFTAALSQVNCHADRADRYSVFSTCKDCESAYLDWLCTVGVPRCQDWSNNASYLVPRPVNTSRNKMINDVIQPGKYKEILPCYFLCRELVAFCPTALGFQCPNGDLMNQSYGFLLGDGDITCSYPGAVYKADNAYIAVPSWILLFAGLAAVLIM